MFFKIIQAKSFLRASVIVGIKLADRQTGCTFAKVKDILIHNPSGYVVGLLISDHGKLKVVELKQLSCVRRYNLEVHDRAKLLSYKRFAQNAGPTLTTFSHLKNYQVLGEDYQNVGKLKDFYFSSQTGRIGRVEVSQSWLKTMLQGSIILHTSNLKELNRHRVMIRPRNYNEYVEESSAGIQMSSAG